MRLYTKSEHFLRSSSSSLASRIPVVYVVRAGVDTKAVSLFDSTVYGSNLSRNIHRYLRHRPSRNSMPGNLTFSTNASIYSDILFYPRQM